LRSGLQTVAIFGLWAASCAAALADFDPARYVAQIHPVAPHVWVLKQPIGQEWHGNVEVIEQHDGLVLVDTGSNAGDGRHIVTLVKSISDKPVKAVILTHWHDDHSLGLSEIKKAWPAARVIAAEGALEGMETMMTKRTRFDAPDPDLEAARAERFSGYIETYDAQAADETLSVDERRTAAEAAAVLRFRVDGYKGSYIVRPTELVKDTLSIADAQTPIEIMFLGRGNSQGDLVVDLPEQKIAIVGDLIVQPVPYGYSVFPKEWADTMRKLDAMDFTLMLPGHGEPVQDRLYLRLVLWSIEDIRKQTGQFAAEGLSLEDVKERIDYSVHREKWAPHDPGYWLDAITASAFNEATGVPNLGGL